MKEPVTQKLFPALGTINAVTIYGACDAAVPERIKACVLDLHRRFSVFDPDSEISKINALAGVRPVQVSEDTFSLLSLAAHFARDTGGTFDITAGPMSRLWRDAIRTARLPAEAEILQCRALCGIGGLELDALNGTAFLRRRGQQLDLGGIAKGFAADQARRILQESGVRHALLNFGGTVIPIGRAQRIGIQNPFERTGEPAADIEVQNLAVVTSGCYERYFFSGGQRYHHLIDPRSGMPSRSGLASVTLLGESAAEMDALSTGVYILGAEQSLPLLRERGIEAIFITDDGAVRITPGLQGRLSMSA